jgi:hypothetical protein
LEYLISVVRDDKAPLADRLEAARAAAPYVHPRLASTTMSIDATIQLKSAAEMTDAELMAVIADGALSGGAAREH